jgi:hypothetical protein
MAHTDRFRALDRAAIIPAADGGDGDGDESSLSEAARAPRSEAARARGPPVSVTEVEETKALAGLVPIFLCVCIWQVGGARAAVLFSRFCGACRELGHGGGRHEALRPSKPPTPNGWAQGPPS